MLSSIANNSPMVDLEGHVFIGKVVDNLDPDKNERIKVTIPKLYEGPPSDLPWVSPKLTRLFGASVNAGVFSVPLIGSYVLVEFQQGDPHYPLYVGSPTLTKQSIPEADVNYPNRYGLKDSIGNVILVDPTPGENTILVQHVTGTTFRINNDGSITVTAVGQIQSSSPVGWTHTGNVSITGNLHVSQVVTADVDVFGQGTSLHTHIHGGVRTGAGTTSVPLP